jgi:GGDEF domain-containing protein
MGRNEPLEPGAFARPEKSHLRAQVSQAASLPDLKRRATAAAVLSATVAGVCAFGGTLLPLGAAIPIASAFGGLSVLLGTAVTLKSASQEARHEETTSRLRSESARAKKLALYDPSTAIFHRWYFELRLEEEVRRSERYGQCVSVIALRIDQSAHGSEDQPLNLEIAQLAARTLRGVDIPASLGEFEYAFCLPNTDPDGARITARRLREVLGRGRCSIGIACYPYDSSDSKKVLEYAIDELDRPGAYEDTEPDESPYVRIPVPVRGGRRPEISVLTTPIRAGQVACIQARVEPFAPCEITYTTPAGKQLTTPQLAPKTADADGLVSWSWKVGAHTKPGLSKVSVQADGQTAVANMVVAARASRQADEPRLRLLAG